MKSKNEFVDTVIATLRKALSSENSKLTPLHAPHFSGNEWNYLKECLDTGWVSSVGPFVDRFEKELASFTGAKYAVAVVNGTAALHISLLLSGVLPGDEVLMPSLTFVATANAITYCQAVPHFVDSTENTLGINVDKLNDYLLEIAYIKDGNCYNRFTGRRIAALVPMHTFGHPADLEGILLICEKFSLTLVEDAAESLGSLYKGQHTGTFGKAGAISFNGNKIMTTGGGGAIITNDESLAKQAKHLTTTAKVPHSWHFIHDRTGFNYRMPNINAALGCAQLEQLPFFIERKRRLAHLYSEMFQQVSGIRFFRESTGSRSNYWLNTLILDTDYASELESLLKQTNEEGIMTRPVWRLLHELPMYVDCPSMDLSGSRDLERRILNIPSGVELI
ncbi:LegC family aminotransferase [Paenibacillus sp. GCM10027628]|uniref:LegC family aminotransferase n=1 Tax=Paenibacillus sp. GCM10027628 TaxID=3273413 RepID=UPI003628C1B6